MAWAIRTRGVMWHRWRCRFCLPARQRIQPVEGAPDANERECSTIEQRLAQAEELLQARRAALEDPAIASDGPRILVAQAELNEAQKEVDQLYERWHVLGEKAGL